MYWKRFAQALIPPMPRIGALFTTLLIAVSLGAISIVVAAPAQATIPKVCKFPGTNPSLYFQKGLMATSRYWTATGSGAARWNAVAVPGSYIAWSSGKPTNVTVTEASFIDPTILAGTSGSCSAGLWTGSHTTFTWATEGSSRLTTIQLRMVGTHELGHSYGLGHSTTTTCAGTKSVMVQGALKWSCNWGTEPWAEDISSVNAIY